MTEETVETLVIVARAPGTVGTRSRLSRELGELEAARLEAAFLADTMTTAAQWKRAATSTEQRRVTLYVPDSTDDAIIQEMACLAGARVLSHNGADAGEQLRNALTDELDRGAHRAFLVGTTAPTLPVHLLDEAMRAVLFHDAVLGPTFDGGAWGLGIRRDAGADPEREKTLLTALLDRLPWGQSGILAQTVERMHKAGLSLHLLPWWLEVTEPSDLPRLKLNLRYQELRNHPRGTATRAALQHQPPPPPPLPPVLPRAHRRA